jgi:thiamine-monophosphate kinase
MPGEFDFIRWVRSQPSEGPGVVVPPGDDMAVLKWSNSDLLLVAADQVLDGRHFDSRVHSPEQIGRKAMLRNLSDCAAMACLPVAAVATVALPAGAGLEFAKRLYRGMREAGDPYGCAIVGGDTGSWPGKLALSVTILGKSAGLQPITRQGARPGDGVYVTGKLGGSLLARHMEFVPRIAEARELAAWGGVTAMIDISDGLSRDLAHLCESVGADLVGASIPIHPDAIELSRTDGRSALDHALHDGEDHELLFTARSKPPLGTQTGVITAEKGIRLDKQPLEPKGWEHSLGG